MVAGMVTHVVKSLNQLPSETGIDTHLSPASLITGSSKPDYNNIIQLNYGDYVQAYEPSTTNNDQSSRTIGAIVLYPRNGKSWYFMSLQTGKRVHQHGWTVLPASKEVVARVNFLGKRQKQSRVQGNFKYRWGPERSTEENDPQVEVLEETIDNQQGNEEVEITSTDEATGRLVQDLQDWEPVYI